MAGVKGRSGGARPGSGPKPAPPTKKRSKALQTDDPDAFLRAVMKDPNVAFKDRMAAALALKKSGKGSAPVGKKQQQQDAAQAVVERSLAPVSAPTVARPKLAIVK